MSAVIVEFPVREKTAKAVREGVQGDAQVIIFPGVRHERLEDAAQTDETGSPRTTRRKKTS